MVKANILKQLSNFFTRSFKTDKPWLPRKTIFYPIVVTKRKLSGHSNTTWDNIDINYLGSNFMRGEVNGVEHPSRKYMREWLQAHPGLTLLDIPCGPAVEYEGFALYKTPVKYIGMDITDNILKVAREKYPQATFLKGDIRKIPLPDKSVDVVLARHILEHLEDYHVAVKEALRVARKHVFLILFRVPTHSEVRWEGFTSWDNRLDLAEMEQFLKTMNLTYITRQLPYENPVPSYFEENLVIQIDLNVEE